ncbi:hypothetical protein Y1Q_0005206 [Alligator mississippiensis]|uniref:Reverse transcriptase domain-containing protein n=1 Tax=Alligator mississippiensis TaxID=8496 RepID=A0A151MT06_ALLMI|nr:hypothetical protein Y1Q_0005206 [Alligator mississippiensis]
MLEQMGVPLTFIGWIWTLYMEVSSKVQISGFLSTWIVVEPRVRQGCPLSLILFTFTIEPLAQCLRQDPGIHGLHNPGSSNCKAKVLAYLDYLNILCWNRGSVERALVNMQVYEALVGAKLNVSKSTCLAVGEVRDLESLGVSVPHEGVRILRIDFNPELSGRTAWESTEAKPLVHFELKTTIVLSSGEGGLHSSGRCLQEWLCCPVLQKDSNDVTVQFI